MLFPLAQRLDWVKDLTGMERVNAKKTGLKAVDACSESQKCHIKTTIF